MHKKKYLKNKYMPTWMEIDLAALKHNLSYVKKAVGSNVSILAPVKANGYGHGIVQVSRTFVDCGVDYLGVGNLDEALLLRRSGITKTPLLILGLVLPEAISAIIKNNITQTVGDMNLAYHMNRCAGKLNRCLNVHIKIDTGMGRIGIWHKDAMDFIREISKMKNLNIEGIYSHLSSADDNNAVTNKQIEDFMSLIKKVEQAGIAIHYRHIANSMAMINYKNSHMNFIRPGIILYGLSPKKGFLDEKIQLRPVMRIKSRIVFLKNVFPGRLIGYGGTFKIKHNTTIATVPIGYGDGLNRKLSNKGYVLIKGHRAPIVGRICMDQIMVDIGAIDGVKLGDEVIIIGKQKRDRIKIEDMADICDTISYEIACCFDKRIPKLYIK
jgi:alanine racemase